MKLRLIATIVTGASAAMLASAAFGQANPQNSGYVLFGYGKPDANIWRSGSYGGKPGVNDTLCWRTGYWTPAMAIIDFTVSGWFGPSTRRCASRTVRSRFSASAYWPSSFRFFADK